MVGKMDPILKASLSFKERKLGLTTVIFPIHMEETHVSGDNKAEEELRVHKRVLKYGLNPCV
jgi:hypothetical protein